MGGGVDSGSERRRLEGAGGEEIGEIDALERGITTIRGLIDESVREKRDHIGGFGSRERLRRKRRGLRRRRQRRGSRRGRRNERREKRRLEERGGLKLASGLRFGLKRQAILDAGEKIEGFSEELNTRTRARLFRGMNELVEKKWIAFGGHGRNSVHRLIR